jgi:hypothetical protein
MTSAHVIFGSSFTSWKWACKDLVLLKVVLYKSPECRLQDLKEVLISRLLPILNIRHSNIIIMGDFNLDIQVGNDNFLRQCNMSSGHPGGFILWKIHEFTNLQLYTQFCDRTNMLLLHLFNLDIQVGNDNFLRFMEDKFKCKQVVSKVTTNYESLLDLLFVKVNSDVNIETDDLCQI